MTTFSLPPEPNQLIVPHSAAWHRRAQTLASIRGQIFWWWGDLLAQTPDAAATAEVMKAEPRCEPKEDATIRLIAERWLPGERRMVPFEIYRAVHDARLDRDVADEILLAAELGSETLEWARRTIARYKRDARAPGPRSA